VQAFILLPLAKTVHCKLGYFLVLHVGLYLLRSFFRVTLIIDVFPQREHVLLIVFLIYHEINIKANMSGIESKIFIYIVIVFSSIVHEYCHAWAAFAQGDHTAKNEGRLTLNPIPHLDLYGTVIIPLFFLFFANGFIGWAKPVPINPYNFKNQKWGLFLVSLAGPASNLFIALILGLFLRFSLFPFLFVPFFYITYINIFLALFNLIPMPPLDGSKLLMNKFPKLEEKFGRSFIGTFIALAIAITILPSITNFIFTLLTGQTT